MAAQTLNFSLLVGSLISQSPTARKLDVFLRTRLAMDPPNFFNTATNIAFSALQYLIGQNKYQSLEGKVTAVPQDTPVTSSPLLNTLMKVALWICAFFLVIPLTAIGTCTRLLSFLSPDVEQAYSLAFLSRLSSFERTPEVMESCFRFLIKKPEEERIQLLKSFPLSTLIPFLSLGSQQSFTTTYLLQMPEEERTKLLVQLPSSVQGSFLSLEINRDYSLAHLQQMSDSKFNEIMPHLSANLLAMLQTSREKQKEETAKKESLNNYLNSAIASLTSLDSKLQEDRQTLEPWLKKCQHSPSYPFPFLLAEQLNGNPQLNERADPDLYEKFMSLYRSCTTKLKDLGLEWDENTVQQTIQASAKATLGSAFKSNLVFFNTLKTKLETPELANWLEEQKRSPDYSYPFLTQYRVLALMHLLVPNREKLQPHIDNFVNCVKLLGKKQLESYVEEKLPSDHPTVSTLMVALDQLENIDNLQKLVKNSLSI